MLPPFQVEPPDAFLLAGTPPKFDVTFRGRESPMANRIGC